jgi:hypothetical protein
LEKLTAVLMNEADDATRSEIKIALASDPLLVAEEQRLRATIAIVQAELGDGATLAHSVWMTCWSRRVRFPQHAQNC